MKMLMKMIGNYMKSKLAAAFLAALSLGAGTAVSAQEPARTSTVSPPNSTDTGCSRGREAYSEKSMPEPGM